MGQKIERRVSQKVRGEKEVKSIKKQQSLKNIPKKKISSNIFDQIHTILQHPKERVDSGVEKVPKKRIEEL